MQKKNHVHPTIINITTTKANTATPSSSLRTSLIDLLQRQRGEKGIKVEREGGRFTFERLLHLERKRKPRKKLGRISSSR